MYMLSKLIIFSLLYPHYFSDIGCNNRVNIKRFHKIKSCHKSTGAVIARSSASNISECIQVAIKKRGLAFNFNPNVNTNKFFASCEILACPENINSSNLIRTFDYDYYSAYSSMSGKYYNNNQFTSPTAFRSHSKKTTFIASCPSVLI